MLNSVEYVGPVCVDGDGRGGGRLGEKGAGGVREVGEEGREAGEIGKNYAALHNILQ